MFTKRHRCLGIESLESRKMLAANLMNGSLSIFGTKLSDNIQVQVATSGPHAGELQVDVNGQQSFFTVAQVNSIKIFGLGGNDQITVNDNVTIGATISGGKGNDNIKGGGGNDIVHGDAGIDTIDGSLGNDTIDGDAGDDTIDGGDGNDNCHGDAGNDTINGDNGDDSISGDKGNDTIHGDTGNDSIHGNQGNDSIWGGDDDDTIDGDQGSDTVDGEGGNDNCHGDQGNDNIDGGDGNDQVWGDDGNDSLQGGNDDDYVDGGNGIDDCHGGAGDDELNGGSGHDRLDGDQGNNLNDGTDGNDDSTNGIDTNLDEFHSNITGTNNEAASAEFHTNNENGNLRTRFELEVEHLAANSTFDVLIDNVTVGQISTDGSGAGELKFSTSPSGNSAAFPANFPTLHAGSTIVVSDLQGSFETWHHIED